MTSLSVRFVEEDLRDLIVQKTGRDVVIYAPPEWQDIDDKLEFPDYGSAKIYDENDKEIGYVEWEITAYIDSSPFGGKTVEVDVKTLVIVMKE
ncbi:MAG: hypothetical protein ACTSUO_06010 [Candidatus Thorarchaeota archaeon]